MASYLCLLLYLRHSCFQNGGEKSYWEYWLHHHHHIWLTSSAKHKPPQVSPQRPVPSFSRPASFRDFQQVIGPPCRGPTHVVVSSASKVRLKTFKLTYANSHTQKNHMWPYSCAYHTEIESTTSSVATSPSAIGPTEIADDASWLKSEHRPKKKRF